MFDHNALDKRGKTIWRHYLFGDKIIRNHHEMNAPY